MSTIEYVPWYSRHRTVMIGSGIAVSTLVITFCLWLWNTNASSALEKNNLLIQAQQEQIAKLQTEINYLKRLPPDTVYITKFKEITAPVNNFVLQRIEELEETILNMKVALPQNAAVIPPASTERDSLSFISPPVVPNYSDLLTSRIIPDEKRRKSLRALPKPVNDRKQLRTSFSVKTARELEKHYRHGIGIRLGPTLDLSKGFYAAGAGGLDISGGLLGDFIFSPSFSVETGAKFIHRFYEISENEVNTNLKLPDVNQDLGLLTQADIDSWMIEVPLNLKYRYPLSLKTNALAGLGYSSLMYTKQVLEYSYNFDAVTAGHVTEPHTITNLTQYAGTLNISLGLSKRLKNNKILETSLYYQHGLGKSGVEKMKSNYLGIRGAYWFSIK